MKRTVLCSVVCLCSLISYASWQNPLFLSELNDYQNGYSASRVNISSDEECILFTRKTPTKNDALWEGHRNPQTGVYDQQRQLSELKCGGAGIYGVWISDDKLRLYYAVHNPQTGYSERPIWMATRSSIETPWQTIKRYNELEIEDFQTNCTLTSDEKTIMWETASFSTGGLKRIFTASRPSILHNFSNFREAFELEEIDAWMPIMSKNGLIVFFRKQKSEGGFEEWMGSRDSLDVPFGDFKLVPGLNTTGAATDPCLSGDGKRLYYTHRPGETFNIDDTGIYMSEWVNDSYEDAIQILQEAVVNKEQALLLIQDASDKEETAMQILSDLPDDEIPAEFSKKDLQEALRYIRMAWQKQQQIQGILQVNIEYLNMSLLLLLPPAPAQ